MGNCADCGKNGVTGHAKDCPRDKKLSRWARYRLRVKAKAKK